MPRPEPPWPGLPAGAGGGPELLINLGTAHPSAHGMLRLRLTLDGDRISAAEPEIGFMHRGAEKLFEARDYRQIIVLANRHDWLGAFASELGVVLAAERLAGIEVPPRAVWARTMLAELNRALSHLAFLELLPAGDRGRGRANRAGGEPGGGARAAFGAREAIQAIMEEISGGRMHYMFNRVGGPEGGDPGGLAGPGPPGRRRGARGPARRSAPRSGPGRLPRPHQGHRGAGTGEQVRQYGVSGPAARACGVDFDLRRDEPYLAYAELAGVLRVPVRTEGDCLARFECLLDQLAVSLDLAQECAGRLASLPQGPLSARLPKVFKVPEGHAYAWTESPLGLSGYYLVSRGGKTPWRLKLRSASFSNMAVLPDLLPGHRVADLAAHPGLAVLRRGRHGQVGARGARAAGTAISAWRRSAAAGRVRRPRPGRRRSGTRQPYSRYSAAAMSSSAAPSVAADTTASARYADLSSDVET